MYTYDKIEDELNIMVIVVEMESDFKILDETVCI